MEELLAFAAALVALRLGGELARRWRARRLPQLAAWSAGLLAYSGACAALAWGPRRGGTTESSGCTTSAGALRSAPLLGVGSLLLVGRRWAAPLGLVWTGLAIGVVLAEQVTRHGRGIPPAQDHLDWVPARVLAVAGNGGGTLAVVAVALGTLRRRPFGNLLVIAGIAVAGVGSALVGVGEAGTAAFFAGAAVLVYAGFMSESAQTALTLRRLLRPTL
jgi:hypothetical protein